MGVGGIYLTLFQSSGVQYWHTQDIKDEENISSLIEQQVIVMGQQTDNACAVVDGCPDHPFPVSALKVGLDHLIIFPITQGDGTEMRASQSEKEKK